jgi:hypothetical protein
MLAYNQILLDGEGTPGGCLRLAGGFGAHSWRGEAMVLEVARMRTTSSALGGYRSFHVDGRARDDGWGPNERHKGRALIN